VPKLDGLLRLYENPVGVLNRNITFFNSSFESKFTENAVKKLSWKIKKTTEFCSNASTAQETLDTKRIEISALVMIYIQNALLLDILIKTFCTFRND
jgi:hypothetical protein